MDPKPCSEFDYADFLRRLRAGQEPSIAETAALMRLSLGMDERDVELANGLTPEAGWYLSRHSIERLILAELDEKRVSSELQARRAWLTRLSALLPEIISLFKLPDPEDIMSIFGMLDDCYLDFTFARDAPRRDKARRELGASLAELRRLVSRIEELVKAVDPLVHGELQSQYDTLFAGSGKSPWHINGQPLDLVISTLAAGIELAVVRFDRGEYRESLHNRSKESVVKCCYQMALYWGGPPLVTTPGSNFSLLCSYVYEAVSGEIDASLAGTINRYARGDHRRQTLESERDLILENEAIEDSDNFGYQREALTYLRDRLNPYFSLAKDKRLSLVVRNAALRIAESFAARIEAIQETPGPFLVWASQKSPSVHAREMQEIRELEEQVRQSRIDLGNMRRARRSAN